MKYKNFLIMVFVFLFLPVVSHSQIYSMKDVVNQYDPFTITLTDFTLNTNDEDIREHFFVIVITITVGAEKVIKFLYRDDVIINSIKNIGDVVWSVNLTPKRNNIILMPALFNIPNNGSTVTLKMVGYSNISEMNYFTMSQLSTSFCYTSSTIYYSMEQVYKFIATSPEINRPNNSLLITAEVLQQNISKQPEIFYLGNPAEVNFIIPEDPKKIIGTNFLVQGKKTVESKFTKGPSDLWNMTITKYTDVNIVKNEPYYVKTKGVFMDLTSQQVIPSIKNEGFLSKAQEIMNDDLMMGRKVGVYLNELVIRQLSHLLNLCKAGIRAKSDPNETTTDFMISVEREALSFFEQNLRDSDFNLENQYVFDDYIYSSVNRGTIQKEIDMIKRYYQIK